MVELSEFRLIYEHQKAIKAQALADFLVEMTKPKQELVDQWNWMFYVDSSLNRKGSGVGVILEGLNDITLDYSLKFDFQTTNNQVEYKALVVGLQLAKKIDAKTLSIRSDSQLVIL